MSEGPSLREGSDILSRIVESKRKEISELARRAEELEERAVQAPSPRAFKAALSPPGPVSVIAEVKRRSPGAGAIAPALDPGALAREYAAGGASALSVLTDRAYFSGSLEDLETARDSVTLPVLRKDFVLSELQILEARAHSADAVLLITRILADGPLRALRERAEELGMTALVEVHDRSELARALVSGASVIGVNNRNLRDFTTRLEITLEILDAVPQSVILVSESGIATREDVETLAAAGVDAILVGEAFAGAVSPEVKVRELSETPRHAGVRAQAR